MRYPDRPVFLSLDHDADGELGGLDELVSDGQSDLRIAALISEGFSQAEVAARPGIPSAQISEAMKALRWEIRQLS